MGTPNFSKRLKMLSRLKITWDKRGGCENIDFGLRSYFLQINLWVVVTSIHKKGFRYFPSMVLPVVQFKDKSLWFKKKGSPKIPGVAFQTIFNAKFNINLKCELRYHSVDLSCGASPCQLFQSGRKPPQWPRPRLVERKPFFPGWTSPSWLSQHVSPPILTF